MDQTLIAATVFTDTTLVATDEMTLLAIGLFLTVLTVLVIRWMLRQPRPRPQARRRRAAILHLHQISTQRHAAMQRMIQDFESRRAY